MSDREQQERHIAELLRLILPDGQPNLHQLNQRLKEMDDIKLVIKQFGHELATRNLRSIPTAGFRLNCYGLAHFK